MSYSNTPKLIEIVLDYTPELVVSSFTPPVMEIDSADAITVTGVSLDRVTAVSWNGLALPFTIVSGGLSLLVYVTTLTVTGSYPLYFQSPTLNLYSASNLEAYVGQFGSPPTLSKRLRFGKFLSRLGFIKYPAK